MSIEKIRADIYSEAITFGPHLVERLYENGISIEQVLNVVLTRNCAKKRSG